MAIEFDEIQERGPRIKVIGVGGGGSNRSCHRGRSDDGPNPVRTLHRDWRDRVDQPATGSPFIWRP